MTPTLDAQAAEYKPQSFESVLPSGATLRFVVPIPAVEVAPDKLPRLEVSGLPGAHVALRQGFVEEMQAHLLVACVEAPSDRWAPGMEDVVFNMANGFAHRAMSEQVVISTWEPSALATMDKRFEQQLSGTGRRDTTTVKMFGKHILGFAGTKPDVVLCSVLCSEPTNRDQCMAMVTEARIEGLVEAPAPSLLVQAVFHAAEKPGQTAGILGLLGMLIVSIVLAKRPRPRA